jgi:hypothetical protein
LARAKALLGFLSGFDILAGRISKATFGWPFFIEANHVYPFF